MKLIFLLLLFPWAACGAPDKANPPPQVFVQNTALEKLFDELTYPARISPKSAATILSETDGLVRKIVASLGRAVRKGETLVIVENTDPIYQYAPVRVTSPIAGVVSAVEITEGSRVTKGQRLLMVTDPKNARITVEAAASDLFVLKAGLTGQLMAPALTAPIAVQIFGVSPFVDPATGTASVEIAPKEQVALPPGLVAKVSFRVREHEGIQVPDPAIVYRGQQPSVRIVVDGKAKYVPVTLGPARRGFVEIVKGLEPNMPIIVRSSAFVADGEPVQVQPAEAPKS